MASITRERISHADLAKDFQEFHERAVELSNDIQHLLDHFVLDESSFVQARHCRTMLVRLSECLHSAQRINQGLA